MCTEQINRRKSNQSSKLIVGTSADESRFSICFRANFSWKLSKLITPHINDSRCTLLQNWCLESLVWLCYLNFAKDLFFFLSSVLSWRMFLNTWNIISLYTEKNCFPLCIIFVTYLITSDNHLFQIKLQTNYSSGNETCSRLMISFRNFRCSSSHHRALWQLKLSWRKMTPHSVLTPFPFEKV